MPSKGMSRKNVVAIHTGIAIIPSLVVCVIYYLWEPRSPMGLIFGNAFAGPLEIPFAFLFEYALPGDQPLDVIEIYPTLCGTIARILLTIQVQRFFSKNADQDTAYAVHVGISIAFALFGGLVSLAFFF
jgi:hypothetical protein